MNDVKIWSVFAAARYIKGKLHEDFDRRYMSFGNPLMVELSDYQSQYKELSDAQAKLEEAEECAKERFVYLQRYGKQNVTLIKENKTLRDALEFYADNKNYKHDFSGQASELLNEIKPSKIITDKGNQAREALAGESGD